ncbi:MAG: PKD domain-containing protein [Solirubrobacteraceae bacterium]
MTPSPRQLAIAALAGLATLLAVAGPALAARPRPPRPVDARLSGAYIMRGRIVSAVRVPGEHSGQAVTRRWAFTGTACGRQSCRGLVLTRQRSANLTDRVVLRRTGPGRYKGSGRFYVALECRGALYPQGELAPYTVTVTIARTVTIQGIRIATRLTATYTNRSRTDRTICPVGPSHDSARYTGASRTPPGPPAAAFRQSVSGSTDVGSFQDTSAPQGDQTPIVRRVWTFGDPASGSANSSSVAGPSHTFSAPGSYHVTLTVTDADGLRASETQVVVAPGPPAAAFADGPEPGSSTTYQFTDQSSSGVGGAAITGWVWNFGDPATGPLNTSSAQNPQHTFTAPGTYQVCLTVTDTNSRQSEHCAAVTV